MSDQPEGTSRPAVCETLGSGMMRTAPCAADAACSHTRTHISMHRHQGCRPRPAAVLCHTGAPSGSGPGPILSLLSEGRGPRLGRRAAAGLWGMHRAGGAVAPSECEAAHQQQVGCRGVHAA